MGYESRLVIVGKSFENNEGKSFGHVLMTIDLSKTFDSNVIKSLFFKETDIFFYLPGDEDKKIVCDDYNDPITEASIEDAYNFFKRYYSLNKIRNIKMALNALGFFYRNQKEWIDKIVVLHYGY